MGAKQGASVFFSLPLFENLTYVKMPIMGSYTIPFMGFKKFVKPSLPLIENDILIKKIVFSMFYLFLRKFT